MVSSLALDRVDFLPPDRVTDNAAILTLKSLVLEPLCRWREGDVSPGLFARWWCDASARHWRFRLRDEARFHDGARCTAAIVRDFIEAILRSRDMFDMPWSYSRYFAGARFSVSDENTLLVDCETPFADMPDVFTEFFPCRTDSAGRPVLGTGPYRVGSLQPGVEAVLEPVGGGAALRAVAIADAQGRLHALHEGVVDAACGLEQMPQLPEMSDALRWATSTATLSVMAYLDASHGPFATPEARLAANLAVDRARIARTVFGGRARLASTVVSPFHLGFARSGCEPLRHDPAQARRLMDAVGGAGAIRLRTPEHMPDRAPEIARAIAEDLGAIGFDVSVEIARDRPLYAREIGEKRMGDVALFDSSPNGTFRVLDDKISSRSRGVWWQGYDDAEAEALITQARGVADRDARAEIYGRCLRRLNASPPWLFLLHPTLIGAWRPGTPPFSLDPRGVFTIGTIAT